MVAFVALTAVRCAVQVLKDGRPKPKCKRGMKEGMSMATRAVTAAVLDTAWAIGTNAAVVPLLT
jgi:hypothetical protein